MNAQNQPAPLNYEERKERRVIWIWCAIFSIGISSGANAFAIWAAASLRFIPPGSSIRPMGVALHVGEGCLLGLLVGFPLAITTAILGRKERLAWLVAIVAIAISVMPWPASRTVWRYYIEHHNLIDEP